MIVAGVASTGEWLGVAAVVVVLVLVAVACACYAIGDHAGYQRRCAELQKADARAHVRVRPLPRCVLYDHDADVSERT